MSMTHEELVLYQSYISELQKTRSKKLIELINKTIGIINNTPEGRTLSDVNKYPYEKTHRVNVGIIQYTIRMIIVNEKELNELLNNKPRTSFNSNSVPLDKMVYSKLYGSVSNLFLYYQDLKDKLNNALDRELEKIEYLEQLLTTDNKMNGLDMFSHFTGKSGQALTLSGIGVHDKVRELMHKPGAFGKPEGSIQSRFISQIQSGERIYFENNYDFAKEAKIQVVDPLWAIGGATVSGTLKDTKTENIGDKYNISGVINYKFYDEFTDPYDMKDLIDKEWNPNGTPFDITGEWKENVNFQVDKDVYENKVKPLIEKQ
ncbi:hypothetical protein [Photorhabdus sp. CRCIA-P01]|uniref:hypothetical protein n=1 Tax=Photorhabdus sp. CRCIA-P01 TaxID=2019570 RepID=UPI000E59951B|nr:hypothetical protein [Photorhabdus sp. CRCIA-P01]